LSEHADLEVYLYETHHPDGSITKAPHKGQQQIIDSNARFKVVVCGRRWGKTMMAVNQCVEECIKKDNALVWYVAPTYRQAKMIAWRFLISRIRLLPKHLRDKCKINESYLNITFWNNSLLELKGVDNPETLLGQGLDHVVLDEYAVDQYARQPVWEEILRPALSDKMGSAMFISTPKGYNHFYDLYEYAESQNDPDWKSWRMPTSTNPYIQKKELTSAKRDLGEDAFVQEYMAEFRKRSGLVYKEFSRDTHIIEPMNPDEIPPKWTMEVGVDFGSAHPTAAVFILFDHIHDAAYIVDEYYQAEQTIEYNAGKMHAIEQKWMKKPKVRWGDSQGKQEILEYASPRNKYFLTPTVKGPESVEFGINEVRKRLGINPITGKPQLFVTKNCTNTIKEFENYRWKETADETKKAQDAPEKSMDDAMDALRYVISHHWSTQKKKKHTDWKPSNPLTGI
jgi:hypothetical protein